MYANYTAHITTILSCTHARTCTNTAYIMQARTTRTLSHMCAPVRALERTFLRRPEAVERRNRLHDSGQLRPRQQRSVLVDFVNRIAKGDLLALVARMEQTACPRTEMCDVCVCVCERTIITPITTARNSLTDSDHFGQR